MGIRSKFQEGREYTVVIQGDEHRAFKAYSPRTRTVYRETTYRGDAAWRKYGTWRHEHMLKEVALFDKIAAHKASPMGNHGLVVRKKAK